MQQETPEIKITTHTIPDHRKSFIEVGDTFSGTLSNPHELYSWHKNEEPVSPGDVAIKLGIPSRASAKDGSREVFSLFGYRDIQKVLRDSETFSSGLLLEGLGEFLGRIITGLDGDEHKRVRGLLQPAFMPAVLEGWKAGIIRPVIESMLDQIEPRGRADLLQDFNLHFPVRIIYAIMGFPADPEAMDRFSGWALAILAGPQIDPAKAAKSRRAAFKAAEDLYSHVLPIVTARRAAGVEGDDMMATLLRAKHEGQTLSDAEVASFVRMLLPAAAETTTRSFSNLLALLLQRPDLLAEVRADRSLIPGAINEVMRYEPPVGFLARQATRDVEIGGVAIPAGAALTLVVSSGNRDGSVFEKPEVFDIRRKPAPPALGFGFGVHMCIGMLVAKAQMEIALNALLDRFPTLELDGPAPEIVGVHFRSPGALSVRWDV